jgi:hypothetical protein
MLVTPILRMASNLEAPARLICTPGDAEPDSVDLAVRARQTASIAANA